MTQTTPIQKGDRVVYRDGSCVTVGIVDGITIQPGKNIVFYHVNGGYPTRKDLFLPEDIISSHMYKPGDKVIIPTGFYEGRLGYIKELFYPFASVEGGSKNDKVMYEVLCEGVTGDGQICFESDLENYE